jgi:deoxyribodipyrimidine photolyase-related protein
MAKIILVLPNGLFENNNLLTDNCLVYIYEHPVFFTMYSYHKMKLVLHRASMQFYYDYLSDNNYRVRYVDVNNSLDKILSLHKGKTIYVHNPVDHIVENDLVKKCQKHNIQLIIEDTPQYLETQQELIEYGRGKKNFRHIDFYKWQRMKYDILMDKNGKPEGKKWSFDVDNRSPFPENFHEPDLPKLDVISAKYIAAARKYVKKHFPKNPGLDDNLYLPIEFGSVKKFYNFFLRKKLAKFGKYQDAVSDDIIFGNHSVLSPLMNIGLITPQYVIDKSTKYFHKYDVDLASFEGYVRQVIGWRSYCRLIYLFKRRELESSNYFNNKNKLSTVWYTGKGSTGIFFIDEMIKKTLECGYLHHIERLMYIGNFMLLSKINPIECFDWFQSMFLDSYHVFMYPNVLGMSQYTAGPVMTTRPYFSASQYINNMSDYKKHKNTYQKITLAGTNYEWFEIWDILFYNFIFDHKHLLAKNYSTAIHVKNLNRKSKEQIKYIRSVAHLFLKKYH